MLLTGAPTSDLQSYISTMDWPDKRKMKNTKNIHYYFCHSFSLNQEDYLQECLTWQKIYAIYSERGTKGAENFHKFPPPPLKIGFAPPPPPTLHDL